ncbi:MAG: hypothetical protein RLZZ546_1591 [Bacteroidota bacterium]|jgi:SPASM domain peptide maturase of grasp-with-spasm system
MKSNKYSKNQKLEFTEFWHYLIQENLLLFTRNLHFYGRLKTDFDFPSSLTNAVIDLKNEIDFTTLALFFDQLFLFSCRYISIRLLTVFNFEDINGLCKFIDTFYFEGVELFIKYSVCMTPNNLTELINKYSFLGGINVYNADANEKVLDNFSGKKHLFFLKENITIQSCGVIGPHHFTKTIPSYTESLHHNSCLNRKISIDAEGNIKNCPSMKESFGNIKDTTLAEAIEKPGFKKYWDINKDKILVCKDCEFRYICTDCRAYVEDPEDILSKPLKCGYNPYTGEWAEWSTNPLKQKAIDFYEMREMVDEMNEKK